MAKGRRPRTTSPRRTPVQARSKETVTAIIQAAAEVLVRDGQGRTTTNTIAERAGISVGTLYHYFPNKASILEALTNHFIDNVTTLILNWRRNSIEERAARGGTSSIVDVEQRARFLLTASIALVRQNGTLARALLDEIPAASRMKIMHEVEERLFNALPTFGDPILDRFREREPQRYEATISMWLTMVTAAVHRIALDKPKGMEDELLIEVLVRSFISLLE